MTIQEKIEKLAKELELNMNNLQQVIAKALCERHNERNNLN